jgi:hypothetical protein
MRTEVKRECMGKSGGITGERESEGTAEVGKHIFY